MMIARLALAGLVVAMSAAVATGAEVDSSEKPTWVYCYYDLPAGLYVSDVGSGVVTNAEMLKQSASKYFAPGWTEFLKKQQVLDEARLEWADGLPPRLPACAAGATREATEELRTSLMTGRRNSVRLEFTPHR